ncbi:MAG: PEGA domain-containing protein [Polyangia bacterium]
MWLGVCLVAALSPGRGRTEGKRGERARASAQAQLEAARLLAAGRDALKAGDTATAERLLTEAYVRVPSPLPFYHLGLLWAQRGQTLLAHDLLRRFDADPAAEPDEAMQAELRRILAEPTPPHGKVQVLGDPGAIVRIGGRLVGALPLLQPALVPPDVRHGLTVEAAVAGRETSIPVSVSVPPGRLVEVRVNSASRAALVTLLPAYIVVPRLRGVPRELEKDVLRTLELGLQAEKKSMLLPEVALVRAPQLAGCLERLDCQQQLAEKNEAEGVFQVRIEAVAGGRFRYRLELIDTATGAPGAVAAGDAETALLGGALRQGAVRQVVEVAARPRGVIKVTTEPLGADVYLAASEGEVSLGKTPLSRTVFGGSLELSLRKAGHEPVSRRIQIEDGQTVELSESLPAQDAVSPPRLVFPVQVSTQLSQRPRPLWRLVSGAAGVGAGVLLVGFGASALSANGGCYSTDCRFLIDTRAPGGALLGTGLLVAIGGAVLLARPGPREPIDVYSLSAASKPTSAPPAVESAPGAAGAARP